MDATDADQIARIEVLYPKKNGGAQFIVSTIFIALSSYSIHLRLYNTTTSGKGKPLKLLA